MQQNELNHYNELYLVKMDIISLLKLFSNYNEFYPVIGHIDYRNIDPIFMILLYLGRAISL